LLFEDFSLLKGFVYEEWAHNIFMIFKKFDTTSDKLTLLLCSSGTLVFDRLKELLVQVRLDPGVVICLSVVWGW
jgi:hypothetical protein